MICVKESRLYPGKNSMTQNFISVFWRVFFFQWTDFNLPALSRSSRTEVLYKLKFHKKSLENTVAVAALKIFRTPPMTISECLEYVLFLIENCQVFVLLTIKKKQEISQRWLTIMIKNWKKYYQLQKILLFLVKTI